jgi:hypothetical protein
MSLELCNNCARITSLLKKIIYIYILSVFKINVFFLSSFIYILNTDLPPPSGLGVAGPFSFFIFEFFLFFIFLKE